jgi:hypothetical protein
MSFKRKILVFPCGSEIGLEIHRSLYRAKEVILYGANSTADHGRYVYTRYFEELPYINSPKFLCYLNDYIQKERIDYIYPAHDSVVLALAYAQERGNLSCRVLVSPYDTCRICRSKKLTMELFNNLVRTPRIYSCEEDVDKWPVFLKPDVGQGSKGTFLAPNSQVSRFYSSLDPSLLMMEYLPGDEFTVDCFTNKGGELVFVQARSRSRIMNGISVRTYPIRDARIESMATIINKKIIFRGAWFFQVKNAYDGQPVLMEAAPRIAGAMGFCRGAGVNLPLMSVYDAEGYNVIAMLNPFVKEMDRALYNRFIVDYDYKNVYMDLDDCIICDGKVNTEIVQFLYQCINKNIHLHLLTRHSSDLCATLKKYRLGNVFDTITHIEDGSPKSKYITFPDAIFIDDSFSERKFVYDALGIPVFAPDAVEALLV